MIKINVLVFFVANMGSPLLLWYIWESQTAWTNTSFSKTPAHRIRPILNTQDSVFISFHVCVVKIQMAVNNFKNA